MCAGRGLHKLSRDAYAIAHLAHAAFQHVAYAEFLTDLSHIHRTTFVREGGVAGDDEHPVQPRQSGDNVLDQTIEKINLLRVAAQITERENCEGGLVGQGERGSHRSAVGVAVSEGRRNGGLPNRSIHPQHERLDGTSDVLQPNWSKLFERQPEPILHMVAHLSRDADTARRTFGLEPCRYIDDIAVDISAIWNHIPDIDTDAEADGAVRGLASIVCGYLLLHIYGAAHRSVDAVEDDEQGIAPRVDDPSTVLLDCWVYQVFSQFPETLESSLVIQPNQAAVANHIRMYHGDQLPPIW